MKIKENQKGNIQIGSFSLLIFISFFIVALFGLVLNLKLNISSKTNESNSIVNVERIILKFESDFQCFLNSDVDAPFSESVNNIMEKYSCYNIKLKDISSGVNINWIPYSDLKSKDMTKLLFSSGISCDCFINESLNKEFLADVNMYSKYFSDVGLKCISFYGWINQDYSSSERYQNIKKKYHPYRQSMFPLENLIPSVNIYYINSELLKYYLQLNDFKINNPSEKFETLSYMLETHEIIDKNRLLEILEVKEDNKIFFILGSKTQFWQVIMNIEDIDVQLIIAGFPESEKSQKISYYKVIKKEFFYENKSK